MNWIESQEIASARARLRNRVEHSLNSIALSAAVLGLIPIIGISVAALIKHKSVPWNLTLILAAACCSIGPLNHLLRWNRAGRKGIVLNNTSVTVSEKGVSRSSAYNDLVGFSIFDLSNEIPRVKLLVFGDPSGRHLSIGLPPEIPIDDIRTFLSDKLKELQMRELPEPRNPYKR